MTKTKKILRTLYWVLLLFLLIPSSNALQEWLHVDGNPEETRFQSDVVDELNVININSCVQNLNGLTMISQDLLAGKFFKTNETVFFGVFDNSSDTSNRTNFLFISPQITSTGTCKILRFKLGELASNFGSVIGSLSNNNALSYAQPVVYNSISDGLYHVLYHFDNTTDDNRTYIADIVLGINRTANVNSTAEGELAFNMSNIITLEHPGVSPGRAFNITGEDEYSIVCERDYTFCSLAEFFVMNGRTRLTVCKFSPNPVNIQGINTCYTDQMYNLTKLPIPASTANDTPFGPINTIDNFQSAFNREGRISHSMVRVGTTRKIFLIAQNFTQNPASQGQQFNTYILSFVYNYTGINIDSSFGNTSSPGLFNLKKNTYLSSNILYDRTTDTISFTTSHICLNDDVDCLRTDTVVTNFTEGLLWLINRTNGVLLDSKSTIFERQGIGCLANWTKYSGPNFNQNFLVRTGDVHLYPSSNPVNLTRTNEWVCTYVQAPDEIDRLNDCTDPNSDSVKNGEGVVCFDISQRSLSKEGQMVINKTTLAPNSSLYYDLLINPITVITQVNDTTLITDPLSYFINLFGFNGVFSPIVQATSVNERITRNITYKFGPIVLPYFKGVFTNDNNWRSYNKTISGATTRGTYQSIIQGTNVVNKGQDPLGGSASWFWRTGRFYSPYNVSNVNWGTQNDDDKIIRQGLCGVRQIMRMFSTDIIPNIPLCPRYPVQDLSTSNNSNNYFGSNTSNVSTGSIVVEGYDRLLPIQAVYEKSSNRNRNSSVFIQIFSNWQQNHPEPSMNISTIKNNKNNSGTSNLCINQSVNFINRIQHQGFIDGVGMVIDCFGDNTNISTGSLGRPGDEVNSSCYYSTVGTFSPNIYVQDYITLKSTTHNITGKSITVTTTNCNNSTNAFTLAQLFNGSCTDCTDRVINYENNSIPHYKTGINPFIDTGSPICIPDNTTINVTLGLNAGEYDNDNETDFVRMISNCGDSIGGGGLSSPNTKILSYGQFQRNGSAINVTCSLSEKKFGSASPGILDYLVFDTWLQDSVHTGDFRTVKNCIHTITLERSSRQCFKAGVGFNRECIDVQTFQNNIVSAIKAEETTDFSEAIQGFFKQIGFGTDGSKFFIIGILLLSQFLFLIANNAPSFLYWLVFIMNFFILTLLNIIPAWVLYTMIFIIILIISMLGLSYVIRGRGPKGRGDDVIG